MSIIKSSVINLYSDSGHHYQSKVSDDRVDIQANTIPLNLKGKSISLTNVGGDAINDIVGTVTSILAQITQINTNISNLQVGYSVISELLADIPITQPKAIYKLERFYGSHHQVIGMTYEDGSQLSDDDKTALVGQYFTHRDLDNTLINKFTGVHGLNGGLYTSYSLLGVSIGTPILMLDEHVEITGQRPADYKLTGVDSDKPIIDITHADDTNLTDTEKSELKGRSFTHTNVDNPARIMFTAVNNGRMNVNDYMNDEPLGTPIFLV
jgi:hypothetical protein